VSEQASERERERERRRTVETMSVVASAGPPRLCGMGESSRILTHPATMRCARYLSGERLEPSGYSTAKEGER
jgi:hypothetical protein